jgi:hypothetical protein
METSIRRALAPMIVAMASAGCGTPAGIQPTPFPGQDDTVPAQPQSGDIPADTTAPPSGQPITTDDIPTTPDPTVSPSIQQQAIPQDFFAQFAFGAPISGYTALPSPGPEGPQSGNTTGVPASVIPTVSARSLFFTDIQATEAQGADGTIPAESAAWGAGGSWTVINYFGDGGNTVAANSAVVTRPNVTLTRTGDRVHVGALEAFAADPTQYQKFLLDRRKELQFLIDVETAIVTASSSGQPVYVQGDSGAVVGAALRILAARPNSDAVWSQLGSATILLHGIAMRISQALVDRLTNDLGTHGVTLVADNVSSDDPAVLTVDNCEIAASGGEPFITAAVRDVTTFSRVIEGTRRLSPTEALTRSILQGNTPLTRAPVPNDAACSSH